MSASMPSLAPLPISSGLPAAGAVPVWVRVVDAVAVALVLIGLSAVITGGFRTEIAGVRVSVTSWWRPIAVAALLLLVRHAARRGRRSPSASTTLRRRRGRMRSPAPSARW